MASTPKSTRKLKDKIIIASERSALLPQWARELEATVELWQEKVTTVEQQSLELQRQLKHQVTSHDALRESHDALREEFKSFKSVVEMEGALRHIAKVEKEQKRCIELMLERLKAELEASVRSLELGPKIGTIESFAEKLGAPDTGKQLIEQLELVVSGQEDLAEYIEKVKCDLDSLRASFRTEQSATNRAALEKLLPQARDAIGKLEGLSTALEHERTEKKEVDDDFKKYRDDVTLIEAKILRIVELYQEMGVESATEQAEPSLLGRFLDLAMDVEDNRDATGATLSALFSNVLSRCNPSSGALGGASSATFALGAAPGDDPSAANAGSGSGGTMQFGSAAGGAPAQGQGLP
jgi:hypothetical protein